MFPKHQTEPFITYDDSLLRSRPSKRNRTPNGVRFLFDGQECHSSSVVSQSHFTNSNLPFATALQMIVAGVVDDPL